MEKEVWRIDRAIRDPFFVDIAPAQIGSAKKKKKKKKGKNTNKLWRGAKILVRPRTDADARVHNDRRRHGQQKEDIAGEKKHNGGGGVASFVIEFVPHRSEEDSRDGWLADDFFLPSLNAIRREQDQLHSLVSVHPDVVRRSNPIINAEILNVVANPRSTTEWLETWYSKVGLYERMQVCHQEARETDLEARGIRGVHHLV